MEETISLKEIYEVLKKRFLLILTFIFAFALIAAIVSYLIMTPKYEASSQFIVNQSKVDSEMQYDVNDVRMNVELINTYNVIIKSPAILDQVVEELNLSYGANELGEKLQVESAEQSQVVTVTAKDEDPALAVDIANTTVEVFQDEIPDIMNVDNVSILTTAELSDNPTPVEPNPILNIAIAIVLGAMVGVGIAFLLEYLDNTITTEDDVEKQLGLPILGVISQVQDSDMRGTHVTFEPSRAKRGEYSGAQKETV
ncbi:Wzz/FepE/Etk N-terminal domain-containing protein [Candidatus Pseudothioglobus singularis]|nr:Wzz/FepE/Etk N-terminal domain-containing protein [Candidatus Pseudothioglobus singularis]